MQPISVTSNGFLGGTSLSIATNGFIGSLTQDARRNRFYGGSSNRSPFIRPNEDPITQTPTQVDVISDVGVNHDEEISLILLTL